MNLRKRINLRILSVVFSICCVGAQAVSLSTYRVYLDSENSSASFLMFNKTALSESCDLSLVHNNFTPSGKMLVHTGNELPDNSAEPWMRYSPRSFIVAPQNPQTVRFTLRRKSGSKPAEYRSYMRISCDPIDRPDVSSKSNGSDNIAKLSIKPKIVQNVPIIVRTGKLQASLLFSDFSITDKRLKFNITRQGNRSVYGTLELVNKRNNDVLVFRKNVSIYAEVDTVEYVLGTSGISPEQLAVRFKEDNSYGGDMVHQQDVITR